ncbi:MAG TPA: GreA/GreB family elongation factor [Verrucomicrobiales bacterium]|nr:GreA/GreB family elongation factor [Verrucomicrobiales bacterium]
MERVMHKDVAKLVEAGKLSPAVGEQLSRLAPGSFCRIRTWGVGRVAGWDLFGDVLTVDFENRPGHPFKLAFALKSLEPIAESHVSARWITEPEALRALAAEDPVELVREILRSSGGSASFDELEGIIKGKIVEEKAYRTWWESTKKKLRQHRDFVVPAKRNLPLELRDGAVDPAELLAAAVVDARDSRAKAKALQSVLNEIGHVRSQTEAVRRVLEDVESAIAASRRLSPAQTIELIVVRDHFRREAGVPASGEGAGLADVLRDYRDKLTAVFLELPVSVQKRVLEGFPQAFGEEWPQVMLGLTGVASIRGMSDMARFVTDQGQGVLLQEFLREGLQQRRLSPDILAWICRERRRATKDVFDSETVAAVMNSLERNQLDDETRRVNRLADIMVSDPELATDFLEGASRQQVRTFVRRLISTPAFDELSRRSLLARVIRVYPEVQELVTGRPDSGEPDSLIVSWESLEKRKRDLEEIVIKRIPENSREIAVARSYGDLRENSEFKAAKEMQAVLMRRKSDLEREIGLARGTDFRGADVTQVSIGTVATLRDPKTGETERLTVLGAWDSDPESGVVSYLSGAGKAVLGRRPGDEVELLDEHGETSRVLVVEAIEAYAK